MADPTIVPLVEMAEQANAEETLKQKPPQDLRPGWLKFARRMQSVARDRTPGYAVLSIRVLVDPNGNPVCWNDPLRRKVEPKSMNVLLMFGGDVQE